ncbi:phenylalanine--tRNA ligase subunit beta [Enterococcus hirae]|nr:phenylalanine--tRNA ligase subunit beta [Enterococcus hirae]
MLVSYDWLKEYIDLDNVAPHDLADQMSLTGIEVEGIEVPGDGLKKIVIGEVKECVPHPDSDHLKICQVDVGEEEPLQIICGAPNVAEGQKVITALVGARIGDNVKIKRGKIRGIVSNGMLCALQELGISDSVTPKEYSDGIYILPKTAIVGDSAIEYLGLNDSIIELSITPNRADALSMHGVAYEVGAIYSQVPSFPAIQLTEDPKQTAAEMITAAVKDKEAVLDYHLRLIEDVVIKDSPFWLQMRLMKEGIRPINNVVDATNYILLDYGQPLHAFDYEKLETKKIVVRFAQAGETLTTLDGEERELTTDDLVITNGEVPVALAGVMGGLDSEITEETTTVALEAAMFEGVHVRKTSQRFNLRSESSARFEKGIDQGMILAALDACAAMIAELSGGHVLSGVVTAAETPAKEAVVSITLKKLNAALGTKLAEEEVTTIFSRLGFRTKVAHGEFTVTIPTHRWDIHIPADLVEEVARIYGYDRLPTTLPTGQTNGGLTTRQKKMRRIKELLEGSGVDEAISYAITTAEKAAQFTWEKSNLTQLAWPMSEERTTLRLNVASGLLDDLAYNIARKNTDIALFETGKVFHQEHDPKKELPVEKEHLALALSGNWQRKTWEDPAEKTDFFTLKGLLEKIFNELGIKDGITFARTTAHPELHPGRGADIYYQGEMIGLIGQIHPSLAKGLDINETFAAELDLEKLLVADEPFVYQAVSKFPQVSRDIALLVDREVSHGQLVAAIQAHGGKHLQKIELFDLYQGKNLASGKKSLAYHLTFADPNATLKDEAINHAMEKITKNLEETFHVEVR